jgi:hypothetical protein
MKCSTCDEQADDEEYECYCCREPILYCSTCKKNNMDFLQEYCCDECQMINGDKSSYEVTYYY